MAELTHKYIPRIPQRENNLFLEEYYSGTDCKVYIDDKEQSEISYISYSVSEQLKPLYGYASRTWDDVAIGNRIVTGTFKMPIKNPKEQSTYEEVVLHQYTDKEQSTMEEINELNKQEQAEKENTEWIDDTSDKDSGDEQIKDDSTSVPEQAVSKEVQEYQGKLQKLGYSISVADGLVDKDGNVIGETLNAIIQFCADNNVTSDTKFTTTIKNAIDKALKNQEPHTINTMTGVLVGPGEIYKVFAKVDRGDIVYILEQIGEWTKIKTEYGTIGYIKTKYMD